jgi:DNA (cytosine-5)-methyltransferase 1
MKKNNLKAVGLFAGVGGIEMGLKQSGFEFEVANEIDREACKTYRLNHGHTLVEGDIAALDVNQLPEDFSLLSGGFPCQPFSVAGHRKGFDDERGNVFWQIDRIYRERKPQVVFLENVKNLVAHDQGRTFLTIEKALIAAGYKMHYKVLNSSTHGNIPQNRERIYIVAFLDDSAYESFSFPDPIPLVSAISEFVDLSGEVDAKYYYGSKTPFFDILNDEIQEVGVFYQWRRKYVRKNKSGLCPTLTANMGMGGHNVPIIRTDRGIRKLTPRECFNLMGMPDIQLPTNVADSHLYKQAGNAVVVPVIQRIGERIQQALGE